MKKIKIGKKFVGEGQPVFIIAEAGVNHNGSLDLAKKMVDIAKNAGTDAVKFQTFKAEDIVTGNAKMADYQKKNTGKNESQLEMVKKFELSYDDFFELKKYCDLKGIIFLSTPHTDAATDFLKHLMPAYKIASGDATNIPFLQKISKNKKPIILSTGMTNMAEVKAAIKAIKGCGNNKIVVLHCTTNYPCPIEEINLRAISTLEKELNLPVGYSDHTDNIFVPIMAVAMGAQILEKHFTIDKNLPGPDHKASLEPKELKEMVENIRKAEKIMGSPIKKPTESEKKIMKIVRKSIVAKKDILSGQKINGSMLIIKRPGNGIEPKYISKIIGKKAKINIRKDQLIGWKMI
jgi:N-acetylneuraminate synthase